MNLITQQKASQSSKEFFCGIIKKIRMLEFDREEMRGLIIASPRAKWIAFLGRRFSFSATIKAGPTHTHASLTRSENCRHVPRPPRVVFAFDADASVTMLVYARKHSMEIAQQKAALKNTR
ncbi:hypothetical protein ACS0PU_004066 [Formica fusca]